MPYGMGDLIGNLVNPGMQNQLATALSPNASPLPQQGQGAPPSGQPAPQPNLAPPAVTQPDPANSNLVGLLLRDAQTARAAEGFNRGTAEMASAFGTAQQQASKKAALGGGGGGASPLGDIADIMKIQQDVTDQNEHARFMSNMNVLAQVLFPGDPNGIAKATEVAQNKGLLGQFGGTAADNAKVTETQKNVDADMQAWIKANPTASPQEAAQHKSDLLEQSVGGLSMIGKELREDRKNYMAVHPGATMAQMIADRPDLADETSYVAIKGEQAKTQAAAGVDRLNAKNSFSSVNPQWDQLETNINWLAAPEHRQAVLAALAQSEYATTGQGGRFANWLGYTGKDVLDAKRLLDQVRNEGFTAEFKNTKNIRSNTEANRIGASFSSLFSPTITPEGAQAELDRLTGMVKDGRANIYAAAGQKIPSKYLDANIDPDYLDPKSLLHNGATFENDFSKMSPEQAAAAVHNLSPGDKFIGPDGMPHKRN